MGFFKKLKKVGKAAYENRKVLLMAATLVAPGVVTKGAKLVGKAKRKIRAGR